MEGSGQIMDHRFADGDRASRPWSVPPARVRRHKWAVRIAVSLVLLGLIILFLLLGTDLHVMVGLGQGCSRHAEEWRIAFQHIPDPEAGQQAHADVTSKRFADGSWVFGICEDSHKSIWGGTIVVKDSRGALRAFFGHVCGPRFLQELLEEAGSVEQVYEAILRKGFEEHAYR